MTSGDPPVCDVCGGYIGMSCGCRLPGAPRPVRDMPTRFLGQPPVEKPTEPIAPLDHPELAESRTKTRETRSTLIVDLEDGTGAAVAAFLEFVAVAVRERRQIRITVE